MESLVVDTSALLAILLHEDDAAEFADALARANRLQMSAPTWLETAIVATTRSGEAGFQELQAFLDELAIEVQAVDQALTKIAFSAWQRYGKGRHPAGLNYGDCFSYALAKQGNTALLFKGNDFSQTDVLSARNRW